MTKGPVALVMVGLFCAAAWTAGGELRARVSRLRWKTGLLLAAIAAAPWFVWMYARFGDAFVQGYVLAGNLYYVTQPASFSGRAVSHTFYFARPCRRVLSMERDRRRPRPSIFCPVAGPRPPISADEQVALALGRPRRRLLQRRPVQTRSLHLSRRPRLCASSRRRRGVRPRPSGWKLARHATDGHGSRSGTGGRRQLHQRVPVRAGPGTPGVCHRPAHRADARGHRATRFGFGGGLASPGHPLSPVVTLLVVYAIVVSIGFPTLERTRPTALIAQNTSSENGPRDAGRHLQAGAVAGEPSLLRGASARETVDARRNSRPSPLSSRGRSMCS